MNLDTEKGHCATLLEAGREIRKSILRALYYFVTDNYTPRRKIVMIGKRLWLRLEDFFYHFLCSLEGIHLKVIIKITLRKK